MRHYDQMNDRIKLLNILIVEKKQWLGKFLREKSLVKEVIEI